MNCPNCGAILAQDKCKYCGYEYKGENTSHDIHIYHHNIDNLSNKNNKRNKINPGILFLLWFFFLPVMVFYTIWQSKKLTIKTKIIITLLIAAVIITFGVISDSSVKTVEDQASHDKYAVGEIIEEQDWHIELYEIKVDYDIDNQAVLLIDLQIEYIGEYAFDASPADLEYTLKNDDGFIFSENKYYEKKDLEVDLKTGDKYIGTIGYNIDPFAVSNYTLNITSVDYERECDIDIRIEKDKIETVLNN